MSVWVRFFRNGPGGRSRRSCFWRRSGARDVNFITDFGYNGRHSYFYVALDKGYYKAEGLNVTILRGQGSIDAIKKVASGAATIGFADAGALVLARSNDAIPVKLLAVVYAKPPHAIFALADSGIKTPKDLEGKTVANSAFSAIPLIFNAYAQATGVDPQKGQVGFSRSASLPSLLATGRVDAIGQFTVGEPLIEASAKPRKLVRLAYKDSGLDYYGNEIIATEQTIKDNPDLLKTLACDVQGDARCVRESDRGRCDPQQIPQGDFTGGRNRRNRARERACGVAGPSAGRDRRGTPQADHRHRGPSHIP